MGAGKANGSAAHASGPDAREAVVQTAGDALAESLDEQEGGSVTDHDVFRSRF